MRTGKSIALPAAAITTGTLRYRGYDLSPSVRMIPEGELFAGTWVLSRCSFGRTVPGGYEIRCLVGDNDHFATRADALRSALLRAMRTVDDGEVRARHLSPLPSAGLHAR